mmetsp:Transcript_42774/g.139430  ORF Transcript_42774/g.139430 Transcript_42774/m.139430 type:complete len:429 (-) Transcript_42774:447-1733(-)
MRQGCHGRVRHAASNSEAGGGHNINRQNTKHDRRVERERIQHAKAHASNTRVPLADTPRCLYPTAACCRGGTSLGLAQQLLVDLHEIEIEVGVEDQQHKHSQEDWREERVLISQAAQAQASNVVREVASIDVGEAKARHRHRPPPDDAGGVEGAEDEPLEVEQRLWPRHGGRLVDRHREEHHAAREVVRDEHLRHEGLGDARARHERHHLEPDAKDVVRHHHVVDRLVVARDGVVGARQAPVEHREHVVRLPRHVGVHDEVKDRVVAAEEVEQRERGADEEMLERKNDLPEADGGQAGRVLVDEVPVVHEGRAVREGEALLVERVALVAPAAVLGIPQLLHVRHGLARGRLAPRRVGRRRCDAAEGQEAGNLLLARLHHRHVERLRLAGRVGPRQLARQTALGRVKVGEEEARDDARGPHEEVAQDGS